MQQFFIKQPETAQTNFRHGRDTGASRTGQGVLVIFLLTKWDLTHLILPEDTPGDRTKISQLQDVDVTSEKNYGPKRNVTDGTGFNDRVQ